MAKLREAEAAQGTLTEAFAAQMQTDLLIPLTADGKKRFVAAFKKQLLDTGDYANSNPIDLQKAVQKIYDTIPGDERDASFPLDAALVVRTLDRAVLESGSNWARKRNGTILKTAKDANGLTAQERAHLYYTEVKKINAAMKAFDLDYDCFKIERNNYSFIYGDKGFYIIFDFEHGETVTGKFDPKKLKAIEDRLDSGDRLADVLPKDIVDLQIFLTGIKEGDVRPSGAIRACDMYRRVVATARR